VLEISDLVATYGPVKALDGVSISVPQGKITAWRDYFETTHAKSLLGV